jgi:hypothetical protein
MVRNASFVISKQKPVKNTTGITKRVSNHIGGPRSRRRSMTPHVLDALREKLLAEPGLDQDEMARFIYNEFGVEVS